MPEELVVLMENVEACVSPFFPSLYDLLKKVLVHLRLQLLWLSQLQDLLPLAPEPLRPMTICSSH